MKRSSSPALLGLAAGYLLLLGAKALLAWRAAGRPALPPRAGTRGRTVIAQAILSGDPALESMLGANLAALPGVRWHWLVDEDDVEARVVADQLRARHPAAGLRVTLLPPPPAGMNPKLFKLAAAEHEWEEGDILVVLDDDTLLPPATLEAMVGALEAGADVATGLPHYFAAENAAGAMLAQFVNDNAALTYLPFSPRTLNGMGYALRVRTLRALGGFAPLRGRLTDDLAVAEAVRARGGRIAQLAATLRVRTTVAGTGHYLRLMHRWFFFARLLLAKQPLGWAAAITVLHAAPPLALGALAALGTRRVALGTLAARALVLGTVQRRVLGRVEYRPLRSELSEVIQPLHLLHALLRRRIQWRRRTYRVESNEAFFEE